MRVKTVYLGLFRNKIGKKEEQFDVEEETSLDNFLKAFKSKYEEELSSFPWAKNESRVDPTVIVMVNGAAKNLSKEGKYALRDGDVVTLMTIISGG
jgi:MoaD family protein